MHLLVLPVSGNLFPVQMTLLSATIDEEYDPDLIFASSGGAVTAVTALGGDWSSAGIRRMVQHIRSELFLQNWWPNMLSFLPSWSLGFFRGSIYNSNEVTLASFFRTYFCESLLTQKELWIGVGNETKIRPELICTVSEEQSYIHKKEFLRYSGRDEGWTEDALHYLNGEVSIIQKMTLASASIPTLVPPQDYQDSQYSDGGVFHASPLSPMKSYLQHRLHNEETLHITYINSADIEDPVSGSSVEFYPGIFRTGAITFANMVSTILAKDRLCGLSLIDSDLSNLRKIRIRGNPYVLKKILHFREKHCQRSFLELYTEGTYPIDINDFDAEDILKVMDEAKKNYHCRFWWIGDQDFTL
jgi:hypothetical protein